MTEPTPDLPAVPGSVPSVHNVDTVPAYWWPDIYRVVLVDSTDIGGRYSPKHKALPSSSGAPPHKHTWSDEHVTMLEGERSILVGEEIKVGR